MRSTTDSDAEEVSIGEIFDVLSDHRRRYALYVLTEEQEPMGVQSLAERMAPWIHDTTAEEVTAEQIERTYVGLRHSQLPKLDEAGAIEYDQHHGHVALADVEPFEDYLSFSAARER